MERLNTYSRALLKQYSAEVKEKIANDNADKLATLRKEKRDNVNNLINKNN